MKIFRILFFMALLAAGLTACQKDDEFQSMAGTWEGVWGFDQDVPTYYERWEFKKNGDYSAYDYNGDIYAKGAFKLEGTTFTSDYTSEGSGSKYRFKGEYDESLHKIIGTWGLYPSYTNRGLFEMTKQ
jgi:hypothetical protein